MSNVPLPRPGPLGLIQYAGTDMQEYAAAVSAAKDAEIERLRETAKALYEGTMRQAAEIAQLRAELIKSLADNAALRAEVAGLRAWLEADARCPCCDTTDACFDDCTFATDCPQDAERMAEVRALLAARKGEA